MFGEQLLKEAKFGKCHSCNYATTITPVKTTAVTFYLCEICYKTPLSKNLLDGPSAYCDQYPYQSVGFIANMIMDKLEPERITQACEIKKGNNYE
jgi:hypothetical protein